MTLCLKKSTISINVRYAMWLKGDVHMQEYEKPEAEVVIFETVDVVATSGAAAPPSTTVNPVPGP